MEGTMATITMFAGDFAPKNWALCMGQLVGINQNQALFSLLGTTFGGDGRTTFALPDFRGRSAVGTGQGNGLTNRALGAVTGSETVTLTCNNLPPHTHTGTITAASTSSPGNTDEPPTMIYGAGGTNHFAAGAQAQGSLGGVTATIAPAGASQPVNIQQPYLALNIIICQYGIFPSRN